jgi:hypothetical protein
VPLSDTKTDTNLRPSVYCRPITLHECARVVAPPPWVGHIPFAFWLIDVLRPRRFVELGTQSGNSFCAFVQAADYFGIKENYFAVDHWQGDGMAWEYDEQGYGDRIYSQLKSHLDQAYAGWPKLLRMSFDQALDQFQDGSIDLLHIDGNHTYEAALNDFETWLPKLSDAGVVLFHDTMVRENNYGVYRVIDELRSRYPVFEFTHSHGLAVVQVGEHVPDAFKMLVKGELDANGIAPQQYFGKLGAAILQQKNLEEMTASLSDIASLKFQLDKLEQQSDLMRSRLQSRFDAAQQRFGLSPAPRGDTPEAASVTAQDLLQSKYFDAGFYRAQANLPEQDDAALAAHYLETGERQGLRPSTAFDPIFYAENNTDVKNAGVGLLAHFLSYGNMEGRLPRSMLADDVIAPAERKTP